MIYLMDMHNTKATKTLKLSTMTIQRSGQVDWAVTGDNHCGPKDQLVNGRIPVKYAVTVTCKPNLDKRGFLFDQAQVDKWLRAIAQEATTLSCEALAQSVAERMLAKLAKDVPHCEIVELELTLQPAPFLAGITVRYV